MRLAIALTHILEAIHTRRILHGDAHPANILYGCTVTSIALAREGLNDSGRIAFTAYFAAGGSAVVPATPVPEGSTAWLLAAGLLVMGLRVWKPRGSREPRSHKRARIYPSVLESRPSRHPDAAFSLIPSDHAGRSLARRAARQAAMRHP